MSFRQVYDRLYLRASETKRTLRKSLESRHGCPVPVNSERSRFMKNQNYRYVSKWSAFVVVVVFVAASGQACPAGMPVPTSFLTGSWTGQISGDVTVNSVIGSTSTNPNPQVFEQTGPTQFTLQIVFNSAGLPTSLPLPVSAFSPGFFQPAVTAFNVGEMQTLLRTFFTTFPTGATDTFTQETSTTTTLTVLESVLSADHFRAVYATTDVSVSSTTSTAAGFTPISITQSSAGTLTVDAQAMGGQVIFSVDFNNTGTAETVVGMTTNPGSGFAVGSLAGILGSGTGNPGSQS